MANFILETAIKTILRELLGMEREYEAGERQGRRDTILSSWWDKFYACIYMTCNPT